MMGGGRAAGYLEKAYNMAGAIGPKGSALAKTAFDSHGAVNLAARKDYEALRAMGRKRVRIGAAGVTGAAVLNASRSPSSGSSGLTPTSSGGMTGY